MDLNINIYHGEARILRPWRYTRAPATMQANGIEAAVAELFDSACAGLDPWHAFPDSSFALRTLLHDTDLSAEFGPLTQYSNPISALSVPGAWKQANWSQSQRTLEASPNLEGSFSNITKASLPLQLVSQPVRPYRN